MMNKKASLLAIAVVILGIFAILIGVFVCGLGKDPRDLPSVMVGRPLPEISLPNLEDDSRVITKQDLPQGKPFLLNVWGTWCPACLQEHPYLLTLQQKIPIIGVNWAADNPNEAADAKKLLTTVGNPFQLIIKDDEGSLVTDLGVYGAPETFLISKDGQILLRYAGVLDSVVWQEKFEPLLRGEK